MNAKFEFTGEKKIVFGDTLNRIRAVASFNTAFGLVAKGEIGGWLEKEENLQVYGEAWVSGEAQVYGEADPQEVLRLDEVREIVLKKPERLHMRGWHSEGWNPDHTPEEEHSCGSAHCIAGWLQALSPDKRMREMEPLDAAQKLAPAAAGSGIFFTGDAEALEWLRDRKYAAPQPA